MPESRRIYFIFSRPVRVSALLAIFILRIESSFSFIFFDLLFYNYRGCVIADFLAKVVLTLVAFELR